MQSSCFDQFCLTGRCAFLADSTAVRCAGPGDAPSRLSRPEHPIALVRSSPPQCPARSAMPIEKARFDAIRFPISFSQSSLPPNGQCRPASDRFLMIERRNTSRFRPGHATYRTEAFFEAKVLHQIWDAHTQLVLPIFPCGRPGMFPPGTPNSLY